MNSDSARFEVDRLYSNEEISRSLSVGNAGGVRVHTAPDGGARRIVVMTSVPTARQAKENPYHDRVENDVLVYTGAGREGDQSLGGMNRRIPDQLATDHPIYAFEIVASRRDRSVGEKRWRFLGLLEYLRHYPETQIDVRGVARAVWLFEFRLHRPNVPVELENEAELSRTLLAASRAENAFSQEETDVADTAPGEATDSGADSNHGGRKDSPEELERVRRALLAFSPERFEHFIGELLRASGYERVAVTRFSQDGGVDVTAVAGRGMWPLENLVVQIQAKRWLHTVGRKEVAELRGSLDAHARGAIVTTSHYSKAAMLEATMAGKSPIVLVDGRRLAQIALGAGMAPEG